MQHQSTRLPNNLINYAPFIVVQWLQLGLFFSYYQQGVSNELFVILHLLIGVFSVTQLIRWKNLVYAVIEIEKKPHVNMYVYWFVGTWIYGALVDLQLITTSLGLLITVIVGHILVAFYRDKILTGSTFPCSTLTKHQLAATGLYMSLEIWNVVSKIFKLANLIS